MPDLDRIAAAFEGLSFETPSGTTRMELGNGHQGIQGTAYGTSRSVGGEITITNVRRYSAEEVNPPEGVKSEEWIRSGFKR
jgi:branched-chain amino acid transport system substrate-binding protein